MLFNSLQVKERFWLTQCSVNFCVLMNHVERQGLDKDYFGISKAELDDFQAM